MPDDCFDSGISSREAQVGGLKLDLPLDEDDYLMPSAQQNQNNAGYMDLIGDSKLPGQYIFSSAGFIRGIDRFFSSSGDQFVLRFQEVFKYIYQNKIPLNILVCVLEY
jgi:hypothetical protein